MRVSFYNSDTYRTAKLKFNTAWPNLKLEVNHVSVKFSHEGWDLFEDDAVFISNGNLQVPLFTLTDEMLAYNAADLFSTHFNGKAFISRAGPIIDNKETLAFANDPFKLILNKYTYSNYKMRFTRRWKNLTISLYDTNHNGIELADNVSMKIWKGKQTELLDDTLIAGWQQALERVYLSATIANKKLCIIWENNMLPLRLKDFNLLEKTEDAYPLAPENET